MAALDSFIKGYQDSQARTDTLQERARQLKELQEQKARQAQQDAEERAAHGLQYVQQQLKDPAWWRANRKNTVAQGQALANMNTYEDALGYQRTAGLSDPLPRLYAQSFAELQPKVASGELTPDAAVKLISSIVGDDVINEETFKLSNSFLAKSTDGKSLLKPQTPPLEPLKLNNPTAPTKPVHKFTPTGDTQLDNSIAIEMQKDGGLENVRTFLEGMKPVVQTPGVKYVNGYSYPVYFALQELNQFDMADKQYNADMELFNQQSAADIEAKKKRVAEIDKQNFIQQEYMKGSTDVGGIKGLTLMFASSWDKNESDRQRSEWDKKVSSVDQNTPIGYIQMLWAEGHDKGWTNQSLDDFSRSQYSENLQMKNVDAMWKQYESSRNILIKEAAKFPGTMEEFNSAYADDIAALKQSLSYINTIKNPQLNPLTGWVDIQPGMTVAQAAGMDYKERAAQLAEDKFDEVKQMNDFQQWAKKQGLAIDKERADAYVQSVKNNYQRQLQSKDGKIDWRLNGGTVWFSKLQQAVAGVEPLTNGWMYGLVLDPVRNGDHRSNAIAYEVMELQNLLKQKSLLGESNQELILEPQQLKDAMDNDNSIRDAIKKHVKRINELTNSYRSNPNYRQWFFYDKTIDDNSPMANLPGNPGADTSNYSPSTQYVPGMPKFAPAGNGKVKVIPTTPARQPQQKSQPGKPTQTKASAKQQRSNPVETTGNTYTGVVSYHGQRVKTVIRDNRKK